MTAQEVMAELEALGTAQNRKVYTRHGYPEPLFGLSFANLEKLRKKIKTDHALAGELWATGNSDARLLAVMVADPEQMGTGDLDSWAGEISFYVLADVFASRLASKSPLAGKKAAAWIRSREEYVGQIGWNLVAHLAMKDPDLDDWLFEAHLATIEKKIHKARNRARHAMNGALIAIGSRNTKLRNQALAAAERIGTVIVDHGETGCKTPDAAEYIDRIWRRKERNHYSSPGG